MFSRVARESLFKTAARPASVSSLIALAAADPSSFFHYIPPVVKLVPGCRRFSSDDIMDKQKRIKIRDDAPFAAAAEEEEKSGQTSPWAIASFDILICICAEIARFNAGNFSVVCKRWRVAYTRTPASRVHWSPSMGYIPYMRLTFDPDRNYALVRETRRIVKRLIVLLAPDAGDVHTSLLTREQKLLPSYVPVELHVLNAVKIYCCDTIEYRADTYSNSGADYVSAVHLKMQLAGITSISTNCKVTIKGDSCLRIAGMLADTVLRNSRTMKLCYTGDLKKMYADPDSIPHVTHLRLEVRTDRDCSKFARTCIGCFDNLEVVEFKSVLGTDPEKLNALPAEPEGASMARVAVTADEVYAAASKRLVQTLHEKLAPLVPINAEARFLRVGICYGAINGLGAVRPSGTRSATAVKVQRGSPRDIAGVLVSSRHLVRSYALCSAAFDYACSDPRIANNFWIADRVAHRLFDTESEYTFHLPKLHFIKLACESLARPCLPNNSPGCVRRLYGYAIDRYFCRGFPRSCSSYQDVAPYMDIAETGICVFRLCATIYDRLASSRALFPWRGPEWERDSIVAYVYITRAWKIRLGSADDTPECNKNDRGMRAVRERLGAGGIARVLYETVTCGWEMARAMATLEAALDAPFFDEMHEQLTKYRTANRHSGM